MRPQRPRPRDGDHRRRMTLFDRALDIGRGLTERRVRLGVTGLSDAGKTVFITALVHGLLHPGRMTRLSVVGEERLHVAVLRPQPSQDLPRFPYEACVAEIGRAHVCTTVNNG